MNEQEWKVVEDTEREPFRALNDLHNADTYRVYRSDHLIWRYDVTAPGGRLITVTTTMWGARRAILKHAESKKLGNKWWNQPFLSVDPPNKS